MRSENVIRWAGQERRRGFVRGIHETRLLLVFLFLVAGWLSSCAEGPPEPPGADGVESQCDRAVLRGMTWLEDFLDREANREDLGMDPVFIFLELAVSSRHAGVRTQALATARRYAKPAAEAILAAEEPLDRADTVELIEFLAEADVLGLDVKALLKKAKTALASHPTFEALYGVAFEDLVLVSTQELFDTVMSIYSVAKARAVHGDAFKVEPGLPEVLDLLADLPLVSAKDDPSVDRAIFRENAYLVTHVAYLLSDYNRIRVRWSDAPWLFEYLRENFDAVLKARDLELVAEFVDVFLSLGLTESDDEDVRAGTKFLLAAQNPDGSWGAWNEREDPYEAIHFTWCAVCGLRGRVFLTGTAYEHFLRKAL